MFIVYNVTNFRNPLRLNVGFLINQSVGYSRDFLFDLPEIHLSPDLDLRTLAGTVRVTRTAQGLLVQTRLRAVTNSECVRCLSDFNLHLEVDFTELYAFSRKSMAESGLILPDDAHIDLSPLVREYMLLEFPIQPICRLDCLGLCPICGENLNSTQCSHDDEPSDPRLAMLKSLLDEPE